MSAFAKAAMRFQAFLLRRNWMGPAGEQLMVINVKGRKTGKPYYTPIGYLRDGDSLVALTNANGASQWYFNTLASPHVTLEIKGRPLRARGVPVADESERRRIFELYKQQRAANFSQYFGVSVDAPAETLEQALASRKFMRFHPVR
jgi:deazaflavin-dependent oxidoreductase (nitroreductase family)